MLDSLKQVGQQVGRGVNRAWDKLAEGWHELLHRSSGALTHYVRGKDEGAAGSAFPQWSLLAGEVEESGRDVVVRVELPGLDKGDCHITIEGSTLYLSGEKRVERESGDSTYHVMERAYGAFQRAIPLPRDVDAPKAQASFRNGVLTVRLPKRSEPGKFIPVS